MLLPILMKAGVAGPPAQLHVSDDIMKRDLHSLSEDGELRSGIAPDAKERMGPSAIPHLHPGATIFLDAGQAVLEVARRLPPGSFSAITHSLAIANFLKARTAIMLGHKWDELQRLFKGAATEEAIKSYRANAANICACAFDPVFWRNRFRRMGCGGRTSHAVGQRSEDAGSRRYENGGQGTLFRFIVRRL